MSIKISVGAGGATAGRTEQNIAGDGAIDTKAEAEAALAYLPEGSTDTVKVDGGAEYTRAQLVELRDRAPQGQEQTGGEPVQGEGVSFGFGLHGVKTWDSGDLGHGKQGFTLSGLIGIPLKRSAHKLFLDILPGFQVASQSRQFSDTTPGGEQIINASAFTNVGGALGIFLRYAPPILNNKVYIAPGVIGGLSHFSSKEGDAIPVNTNCTVGDFGRAQCKEPTAGSSTRSTGADGVWDPNLGANRSGASGLMLNLDFAVALGVSLMRSSWGSMNLELGPTFSIVNLHPKFEGYTYLTPGLRGGITMPFGGADAYVSGGETARPDKDNDGVPDAEDKCPEVAGTKENGGCPATEQVPAIEGAGDAPVPEGYEN